MQQLEIFVAVALTNHSRKRYCTFYKQFDAHSIHEHALYRFELPTKKPNHSQSKEIKEERKK